jgi:peptidoglycan/xylan/chitin deacetylase (PgdA/CDA1 family)
MSRLKELALQVAFSSGAFRFMQFATRRQAVILNFHRFCDDGEGVPGGLPVRKLASYLEYLTRRYRVVSLSALTEDLQRGNVRPNTAAVTVDDGYHEAFSLAAPLFRRYGVPACFFVVSDFADGRIWLWPDRFWFVFRHAKRTVTFRHRGESHVMEFWDAAHRRRSEERWCEYAETLSVADRDELLQSIANACEVDAPVTPPQECRPMTWAQLRELAGEGFEIGSHTRTHPILSHIESGQLQTEITGSKELIERRLGCQITHFAYPNGRKRAYSPAAVEAVSRAGYQAAVTTEPGGNTLNTSIFELHRIDGSATDLAHFGQSVCQFDLFRAGLRERFLA